MKLQQRAFNIRSKLMLLGLGGILVTSLSLVIVGIWQGGVFSKRATSEATKLVDADLDHIVANIYNLVKAQDTAIQQKINHDLKVARYVVIQAGNVNLSREAVPWQAVNQYTGKIKQIKIPKMLVGKRWFGQNKHLWMEVPVVDLVRRLVGDSCTIFQLMNPQGDLLRVATNVEDKNGARAIGTYIPAINPDGKPNPVVATIMKGETYRGISHSGHTWHITAYEPLYDKDRKIIGVLHVGVELDSIDSLRNAIMQVKIGDSGYVFILGGKGDKKGHYIISKNGKRDGENLWGRKDFDGRLFIQSMIKKTIACKPGEFATVRYPWKNYDEPEPRWKIARLTYYEPWDWVIGASAYEDEINQSTEIFSQGYKTMIRVFGIMATIVAIIAGVITWLFARRISNTLTVVTKAATKLTEQDLPNLVKTMNTVNEGDLSVTFEFDTEAVEVKSDDELGTMADAFTSMNLALVNVGNAFNTMVANIGDLTGQLEKRVEESTAELRTSESRMSHIIDFLPDATLVIDNDGKVIAWNHAMEKMTGIAAEHMLGEGNYEYAIPFYGERRPILIDLVLNPDPIYEQKYEAFKREANTIFGETTSSRLRNDLVHLLAAASPLYDANHQVAGAIGSIRDISEWKRIENELIKSRFTAEEATKSKSVFLANMSHEIRTPMNGVIGMASLLLDTEMTKEQREYARTVKNSADALLTIINDILDFSKIEAGKLEFEDIDFDLRITLDEIAELVSIKADEKGIEFANYVHPDVPSLLQGDPGRLRQVILNLTTNAIKFTHEGDVVVEVATVSEDEEVAELKFSIKDSGIGIAKDRLNRLFRSFSQVDNSTTRKFGGTGLGLAISKKLVKLMGGRIEVESEEGKGSVFWFTARLKKQVGQKYQKKNLLPEDIQDKRIIAVDDNETNRKIMQAYLQTWKCHATVVESAQQALALLSLAAQNKTPFDMAIIDFMMPDMDGETLGKTIKAIPDTKDIRMVLLTSRGIRGDAARARDAGFDAYLTKPIKQSQLFNAVISVFGKDTDGQGTESKEIITRHSLAEKNKRELHILLAEDNLVNQKVALIHLKKFGYTTDIANNGLEALEAVEKVEYDLILMDVQMPEMDGLSATRELRKAGHKLPIIAMTANAMKGDREKCLESGMDDYITKPVNPQILLETIKKWSPKSSDIDN